MDVLSTISTRRTAQTVKADPRQVKNAAGGFAFAVSDEVRLHRFLTLGTDGGTYYTNAAELTRENAEVVFRAAAADPVRLVQHIVEVSVAGRAPKQNPALFALAVAAASDDVEGRRAAAAALPSVARTGTHLYLFVKYMEQFRGWGPAMKRAVGSWYLDKGVDRVAYQLVKYRQREGWMHRDLLRLSSPVTKDPARRLAFNWAVGKGLNDYADKVRELNPDELKAGDRNTARPKLPDIELSDGHPLAIIADFEDAQRATTARDWVKIIKRGNALPWEALPDAALTKPEVWEALIEHGLPQTALMRQLPRLTRLGVLAGTIGNKVAAQLQDSERLRKGRVHPINALVALRTYASGHSARGDSTWMPVARIVDALDAAFYNAYGAVEPAGKRTLLALDVSGSMTRSVSGLPVSCREAAAALALVTANVETDHQIIGFTAGPGSYVHSRTGHFRGYATAVAPLDITPRRRLDDVCRYTGELDFGNTDCALPMIWARKNRIEIDTFHVYTDNETFYGSMHPHQALREYRDTMGIDARLVVVAMTATGNSIADPTDPGQLDVSGFDSAVPQLLADFSRGDL
ncbi:TROVE domain-containing protein [Mycobacteroides abscessus subsp. massiliense]|uniref:TROVE domain-containing protein n=1 Tax=Mycobacteroides abscessus TaxID=36809 RepID=UPI0009A8F243|nr:TROVE domain-containing protein [Mycobacteroides abscessus]SKM81612.1 TROVE domain-containing protein [Mycobacteroides abscessus subsp. massiliense]SKN76928.1 TROVE domain-containing protein [Mycobacteroides abscessus subsp. massiliense]SKN96162.1 TROVE domain-containing protein [Mycobacteroides abscessus subsp. massiliense]SKO21723.1 TROVE domain-containing protein [Mycobacteroides abscessus subsp. massiliense]